jgi:hypothetical protein
MSCPYKYIFGVPKKGFHEKRIFGLAFNDTIGTIVLAILTSYMFNVNIVTSLLVWFIGGEVLHYLFGSQTALLTLLDIEACP